jgi:alkanesulfonate monooxygenase SsuD/methylene tetrahydromethanopterin reductase-like flavin-dependent oxidoreductase (luciferase family)
MVLFFKAYDAQMDLPKEDIPITIAAQNSKMIQIAARYADIWEISYLAPQEFKTKEKEFDSALVAVEMKEMGNFLGYSKARNIARSLELDVIIAENSQQLEAKKKRFEIERCINSISPITRRALIGTPDIVRAKLEQYVMGGVTQFLFAFLDPYDRDALELLMDCAK